MALLIFEGCQLILVRVFGDAALLGKILSMEIRAYTGIQVYTNQNASQPDTVQYSEYLYSATDPLIRQIRLIRGWKMRFWDGCTSNENIISISVVQNDRTGCSTGRLACAVGTKLEEGLIELKFNQFLDHFKCLFTYNDSSKPYVINRKYQNLN